MKRIATGSQVAAAPTFPADSGTPGYFADAATTPSAAPTQLSPKWVTSVQEAICLTILESGAALSDTMAQFSDVVDGVHGIKANATSLSGVTTPKTRVAIAATGATVSGANSAAMAASGTIGVTGARSAAIAAGGIVVVSGADAAALGVNGAIASGDQSTAVGGVGNAASGHRSTCVGGSSAAASAADAGTFAGNNPTASGLKAVAAGGHDLTASGENAAAVGGATNTATGTHSFAGGGSGNSIGGGGTYAAALGGQAQTLSGSRSATVGGNTNTTSGSDSVTIGGVNHVASGIRSIAIGGDAATVSATDSVVIASSASNAQSNGAFTNMVLAASKNAVLVSDGDPAGVGAAEDGYCVAGGYAGASPGTVTVNTNLTWMLSSKNGMIQTSGTITASTDPNSDFAEMFENAEVGAIPDGTLLTRVGRKVRIARPGDRVMGVVSATPGILLGTGGLHYAKRYAADEFGRPKLNDDGSRIDAEGYDNERPNAARTARPDEWTAVALVGQVRVRIGQQVEEGDYLTPGADGCALGTLARPDGRPVEVMEITSPYDKARGYGVALCLVG